MKPISLLAVIAGALFVCGRAGFADELAAPVESARPAVYTTDGGARTEARLAQYVDASPYGYTWYGSSGYVYEPTSFSVAPSYYGPTWYSGYYAPTAYSYRPDDTYRSYSTSYRPYGTSYRSYYASQWPYGYSTGWLPYAYHYRPYGSFYRHYGPAYGSGFHLWFGY